MRGERSLSPRLQPAIQEPNGFLVYRIKVQPGNLLVTHAHLVDANGRYLSSFRRIAQPVTDAPAQ
jgi:hypothetical protein